MAEYVKAAGILLGGVGVLLLGYNADAIGEKGLTKIGSGVQGGLEGHMSAEAADRQFGEEAYRRFASHFGNRFTCATPISPPRR